MADNLTRPYNRPIDVLPDDVLLTIFDCYVVQYQDEDLLDVVLGNNDTRRNIQSWQSLVHVCRRWRGLVFASPRRLNLQLFYLPGTQAKPAKKSLDIWPALPLLIHGDVSEASMDDVIAELEHSDRICQISLTFHRTPQIEKLWTAMRVPFQELTDLYLQMYVISGDLPYAPVLPDSFLGRSAPRLRLLALTSISFPELPKLLLSASHLVHLWLIDTPHSGYISPEAMATCLSMLTSLERLQLDFESPQSSPDQENRRPPPPTRYVLPTLAIFWFKGVNEYLEELVAQIHIPRLYLLSATFFNDIDFDMSELILFISHSSILKAPNEAHILFDGQTASVKLRPQKSDFEYFTVEILCREPNWQLSSLAQICTTSFPLLSTTENLFIYEPVDLQLDWEDGIENIEWLELLFPFTAVKSLYLSKQFAPRVAPALQEMTEGGTTEKLPNLQNLYLEGFQPSEAVEEGIERFISSRHPTDHPVAVSVWDKARDSI